MSSVEQQLVARARRGDKGAFDTLVRKHRPRLARLLARFVRDSADVEDVTQEAFIKAYRALPLFRGDSAFYTWLYVIGVNTARNYLKAMGRRVSAATAAESEDAEAFGDGEPLRDLATPESLLMASQVAAALNDAIERLPEELRSAMLLRELELMDYGHIARRMGCPLGTVRSRIFRARETVAARLRPLLETPDGQRW